MNAGAIGKNMFAYCNNNPINLQDPDGKNPTIRVMEAMYEQQQKQMEWYLKTGITSSNVISSGGSLLNIPLVVDMNKERYG